MVPCLVVIELGSVLMLFLWLSALCMITVSGPLPVSMGLVHLKEKGSFLIGSRISRWIPTWTGFFLVTLI